MTGDPRGARPPEALTYERAGVDVDGKARLLAELTPAIAATHTSAVAVGVGAFAGALRLDPQDAGYLAATVDGVGTKTLLARRVGRDEVIGSDIVAHCANDLVASGARPLAFLDYIAMAHLQPAVVAALIGAMTRACRDLSVVLLGGETAEMPDVYAGDAYDVVGTMIGLVPPEGLITRSSANPGDRLIGLASTGLHTNGYSLARRVLDEAGVSLHASVPELGGTLGEALLAPHQCYAPGVLSLLGRVKIHAVAHITGGGLIDNVTRVLPDGCRARMARGWPEPPIFGWLQRAGRIPDAEMVKTFNLGIGMVMVTSRDDAAAVSQHFSDRDIPTFDIGEIVEGFRGVDLE